LAGAARLPKAGAGELSRANTTKEGDRLLSSAGFCPGRHDQSLILLRDHDTKFKGGFDGVLRERGVRVQKG
jgi:hypothetical protein